MRCFSCCGRQVKSCADCRTQFYCRHLSVSRTSLIAGVPRVHEKTSFPRELNPLVAEDQVLTANHAHTRN